MIRNRILTILLTLATVQVSAQHVYTLEECQTHALQSNIKMKIAAEDVGMAQETRRVARTKYIPTVTAHAVAFDASRELVSIDMPAIPGLGSLGTLGMVNDGQLGGVTALLPLYAGGQIHNGNKLAELGEAVSRLRMTQSESEVRLTTARYYWQVVMLKEKLRTLDSVDSLLAEIGRNVKASVDAGVALRNDLLQINLKQNDTRSTRLQVTDGLYVSRLLLAQYIGLGLDSIDVAPMPDYVMPPSPSGLYVAPTQALDRTAEYRLLQHNVSAQKLQQKMVLGKNLPTLAIGGGYNHMNIVDKGQNFLLGFATLSVPISSWLGGTHEVRKQKMAVRKAEMELQDNSELLRLQMTQKWNKVGETFKQLSIALESIGQSEENLRLQTNTYTAGLSTMSDLLEAQTIYQRSRDSFVDAYVAYRVSCAEYLKATGR